MRAHLSKLWNDARASYWFWPSMMAISAIVLAQVTIEIDTRMEPDWPERIPFVYSNQPDGARALLATVAGSMITVTGITFSLTLLAVSQVTSQFGPRLLTNFMRDRGNQITLGTFIATFLYCLMVLRTVRNAEETTSPNALTSQLMGAFVPHVSIFIAILLTLASVGVLIYFIHHIPESIRLSNVVADVGRELIRSLDKIFPESIAEPQPKTQRTAPSEKIPDNFTEAAARIPSAGNGYIQAIDETGMIEAAIKHDLILKIHAAPGDFVSVSQPLLSVYPVAKVDDELIAELQFMFARGNHRTATQNSLFLVDQLVEVIARALSPGINDPMSAMTCMDWLQSALIKLSARDDPQFHRFDQEGRLRVIGKCLDFEHFCARIFDQIRPYVATDRNAALRLMEVISHATESTERNSRRLMLRRHGQELIAAAEAAGMFPLDIQLLRASLKDHAPAS